MTIRTVTLSPPKATAKAAAQTGSMAMITAARGGSIRAWAQVCSTMVERACDEREVEHDEPVVAGCWQLNAGT